MDQFFGLLCNLSDFFNSMSMLIPTRKTVFPVIFVTIKISTFSLTKGYVSGVSAHYLEQL